MPVQNDTMQAAFDIPDDLLADVTAFAERSGCALNELVTASLRRIVASAPEDSRKSQAQVHFPIIHSDEPGTWIVPDDIASQLELIEDRVRYEAPL